MMPSGLRGSLLITGVVLAAFLFGYKQDQMASGLRSQWSRWRSQDAATPQPTTHNPVPASPAQPSAPVAPPPAAPVPAPPAEALPPATPSLGQSLDSVTPGSIQPKQEQQRNLYFEKLSQQLKELRGENPPPPPEAPPPPPPENTLVPEDAPQAELEEDSSADDEASDEVDEADMEEVPEE